MAIAVVAIVALVVLVGAYGGLTFNSLVRMRNECDQLFSDIDVALKRRHDLIPNLVETVRGYATHEREVFEDVTAARSAAVAASGPAEQARTEAALTGVLARLMAVAENYPQLRANQNFLALQAELTATEDRIQRARQSYNASVRDMNVQVQSFPSSVVARIAKVTRRDFFEVAERADREASALAF